MCVDPSARMLEQIPDDPRLVAVQASAEDLASGRAVLPVDRFEAILIKEATSWRGWVRQSRAALIYQHASRQVDQSIADKLSALIEGIGSTVKDPDGGEDDGTSGVLVPAG